MADEKKYRYFSTTTLKAFVSDIKAKVTAMIPTKTSQLTNDKDFITSHAALQIFVPITRRVNNKALSADISLTASDVGAAATSHTHTLSQITDSGTHVYDATEQRTANTVLVAPNGSNGAATFRKLVKTDLPSGISIKSSTSVTVATSAWSDKATTVTVSGVTANNDIIVSYKPESKSVFETAGIYASAQAANSITFTCATVPTASVTINVLILT